MATNKKALVLTETHKTLKGFLENKNDALPKDLNTTRFLQNCMTVLQDTKGIENCEPTSVARTLLKGAFLGLDFFQKECYAIPYGNSLQFQTDYKGETKLAKKYSIRGVKDIYAKIVKEGDIFEEEIKEGQQIINFKPLSFNNNPIVGAFAVVLYQDGGMEYEAMSVEEIEAIRKNFSKMPNGLMWTKTPGEAYKKTVLRRLVKKIEKDFASIEQAKTFEESSDATFKKEEEITEDVPNTFVDVEFEENFEDTPFEEKEGEPDGTN